MRSPRLAGTGGCELRHGPIDAQHRSCPQGGICNRFAQILSGEKTHVITEVGRVSQGGLLLQAHVEEPGPQGSWLSFGGAGGGWLECWKGHSSISILD